MLGINLSLARRTMMRQLGYGMDLDGATENLQITNPRNVYSGEYSLKADFSGDVVGQAPAGWTVTSGAYTVQSANPSPFGGTKYLECGTSGVISIPCNQAYGRWEFDVFKGNDNNEINISFIALKPSFTIGYAELSHTIRINNLEQLHIKKDGSNLLMTATNYVSNNIWYRIKVERLTNGQFSLYIKGGAFGSEYISVGVAGGSGTNPVTDATYTNSNYFVIDLDQGDRIANIVCEYGTGSFDLSGFERIFHSGNRDFETATKLGPELFTNGKNLIDSNADGLADDFSLSNGTPSITSGNGFARAQRATSTSSGAFLILNPNKQILQAGKSYQVIFKYRGNVSINFSLPNIAVLKTFAANTGEAKLISFIQPVQNVNSQFPYFNFSNASANNGEWFEIGEYSVQEASTDWIEKGNHKTYIADADKKSGSYSLAMVSSGPGDALNNYIELPASKFRILQNGDKYTIDGPFARGTGILSGSNIVTNGDFTTNLNSWQTTGNHSAIWNNGVAEVTSTGNYGAGSNEFKSYGNIPTIAGKQYKISLKVKSISGSTNFNYQVDGIALSSGVINTTDFVTLSIISACTVTGSMSFRCGIYGVGVFQIDNVRVEEVISPTITVLIGGKQKTINNISCIPGAFTKLVHNFECTAAEVNQPIRIFCNQADTIYLDEFSFPQAFDAAILVWAKPNIYDYLHIASRINGSDNNSVGYAFLLGNANTVRLRIADGNKVYEAQATVPNVSENKWRLLSGVYLPTAQSNNLNVFIDGSLISSFTSILGKANNPSQPFTIGKASYLNGAYYSGPLGELQWVRFNNINLSDFDGSKYFKSQIPWRYSGGGALVTLHMKFKGPDDSTFLKDYSPLQQLVTGVNVTKADQVRGSYPYYSR